jgi:hypothetical protein
MKITQNVINTYKDKASQHIIDLYSKGNSFLKIKKEINIPLGQIKLVLWDSGLYEPANLKDTVKCKCCNCKLEKTYFTRLQIVNANYLCKSCVISLNDTHQLKKFGLTKEKYNVILKQQNNACAICNTKTSQVSKNNTICRLAVDHDHKTGKVRGLLCGSCNRALGLLKDSISNLQNAISYLKESVNTEKTD